jgi:hypothetical protein
MPIDKLIDQLVNSGNPIDAAWNMFIFVHITLVGGIYAIRNQLSWPEKTLICIAYIAFAWINFGSLDLGYKLYISILRDIQQFNGQIPVNYKNTVTQFQTAVSHLKCTTEFR